MIDLAIQIAHGVLLAGPNVARFCGRVWDRVRPKRVLVAHEVKAPPPTARAIPEIIAPAVSLLEVPFQMVMSSGPPAGWARYHGARPEPRGAPANSVLALHGHELWQPEDFDALFELCEALEIPADSLWTVIRHESHGDPSALNPEPAAGLIQLTTYAKLPGYETPDKIRAIAYQPAREQLRGVVRQHYERAGSTVRGMTPGELMLFNFTPKFVGRPESTVISSKGQKIYDRNHKAFDRDGKGTITVGDIYKAAERVTAEARGRRVTREGKILGRERREHDPAVASAPRGSAHRPRPAARPAPPPEEEAPPPTFVSRSNVGEPHAPSGGGRVLEAVATGDDETPNVDTGGPDVRSDSDPRGLLLAAVREQAIEPVTWTWVTLAGEDLEVLVPNDAFRATLGDTPGVRIPVSYAELRDICKLLSCVPATKAMVDAIYLAAQVHPRSVGLVSKPSDTLKMNTVEFVLKYHDQLEKQLRGLAAKQGLQALGSEALIEPAGKWWIFDPRMRTSEYGANAAVNYGWFQTSVRDPIQTVGGRHDDAHCDYSQLGRAVHRYARRPSTGERVDLLDLYAEKWPDLARFVDALR